MNRLTAHRRMKWGLVFLTALLGLLALRLIWIQGVMSGRPVPGGDYTLAKMAEVQSEREIVLDTGRGRLLDRSGFPLAGETIWTAVLLPPEAAAGPRASVKAEHEPDAAMLRRLAALLGTDAERLKKALCEVRQPYAWPAPTGEEPLALTFQQADEISKLGAGEVVVLPYSRRYGGEMNGRQWIGYLSESVASGKAAKGHDGSPPIRSDLRRPMEGTAGLEKTLEPLLRGIGHTEVVARVDAEGKRLPESGLTVRTPRNPYYPLSFYTTIDRRLQEGIEKLASQDGIKEGSVVVLDAQTGDIASMVSLPLYNPEDISPEGGEWNNRALQAAVPGSIFKLVTAAAALEAGVTSPGEVFHCSGEYGRYGLSCPKEGGHGSITLEQGFAQSCNAVFAALAERLTDAQLEAAASALGLGRPVGWRQADTLGLPMLAPLAAEQAGTVFAPSHANDPGARVQTAIGQRDAAVTPLQAANLVAALLRGGEPPAPRILRRVDFANGQNLAVLPPHAAPSPAGRISPGTASLLLQWMRTVVTDGTGRKLRGANWDLAGKSGTAQTQVKGVPRNNQWFVGYGPYEQPRYTAAVLVQNRAPGSPHAAVKLFGEVMDLLAQTEQSGGLSNTSDTIKG
nr:MULTISPECIES: penicillin-binding protein 2 [Paenibacillus]